MPLPITSIYAALTALIFLTLSIRVIIYRRANIISLGDSGDKNLLKRMRAQANCAEYAPLALILLMLSELAGAPSLALHVLGILLVAGRALHAIGFASTPQKIILRQLGMAMNIAMITFAALGLLGHALF
ncbi:MAPEG family protein [uncultured Sulfitobacter sp.]|uniref:MAPEG family protein n=1 Tax=uncultured Sulfitobacter sp. TaxID=191468 RepID=UPI0030F6574C